MADHDVAWHRGACSSAHHVARRARVRCWSRASSLRLCSGRGSSFTDRGDHELKGVPGAWRVLAVDL